MKDKDRLIVALDVPGATQARQIVQAIGEAASTYKVGNQLFTAEGPQVADDLRPLSREELITDLVRGCGLADSLNDLAGLCGARDIERHYEPVFVFHRLKFTALRQDYCGPSFSAMIGVSTTSSRTGSTPSWPMPSILAAV